MQKTSNKWALITLFPYVTKKLLANLILGFRGGGPRQTKSRPFRPFIPVAGATPTPPRWESPPFLRPQTYPSRV